MHGAESLHQARCIRIEGGFVEQPDGSGLGVVECGAPGLEVVQCPPCSVPSSVPEPCGLRAVDVLRDRRDEEQVVALGERSRGRQTKQAGQVVECRPGGVEPCPIGEQSLDEPVDGRCRQLLDVQRPRRKVLGVAGAQSPLSEPQR
ncbi:hypothetical protein ACFPM0_01350 [Pseudonocardia sulfidoxydans]|uniref:hypothetical protein n=1 Tax=Pseudonocardia sulfidoxydans TaxID=54011 RepID=UPI003615E20C